jgi:hypothetical protein
MVPNVVSEPTDIERHRAPKHPGKRATPFSLLKAPEVGVQVRTPTRQPPSGVGDNHVPDNHQAKQSGFGLTELASHARTYRACAHRSAIPAQVYRAGASAGPAADPAT